MPDTTSGQAAGRETPIAQVRAAIAAQEALRASLGEEVVEVTLSALRAQLAALEAEPGAGEVDDGGFSDDQALARLRRHLPVALADKARAAHAAARREGERKQVTVLFADLTGFTALAERLDPEVLRAFQNDLFAELASVVYQYEGFVEKFVGDAVLAVFGAPLTHEDDPERALRAALAMRERVEDLNRRWVERLGAPLRLHVGVSTGTVVAGELGSDLGRAYAVTGDTINTASRLQHAAQPGQILVGASTYRLSHEAFTFEALESIRVKGKREALPVFELERAKLMPGKSRGLQGLTSGLVGREQELAQLAAVAEALRGGQGRIVTVSGEAGIGKSRLMAEWRRSLGDQVRWLEGRSFPHTTALAYGPFLDLLRRYVGIQDDDDQARARTRLREGIEHFFPGYLEAHALLANALGMRLLEEEASFLGSMSAEAVHRRLLSIVEQLFARLAAERPTVIVIEDMHWVDQSSFALMEHLIALVAQAPLALVGVCRPDHESSVHRLAASAASHAHQYTHIALGPLAEGSMLAMVEQLLASRQLPRSLRRLILSKAEGNPFFVEEVIRALIDRGALMRSEEGDGWLATPLIESVAVPDTLQGVLMSRLDRLPDETKWVVQQAAVIGRIFLYRVLLQMSGSMPGLDADLSHLEREQLIRERARDPEMEYIFKHGLTQEVAYESLLTPVRRDLHRRVGEAMEAVFADRIGEVHSILAEHFLRGEAWEKALGYFTKVGDAAARLYAYPEARLHYAKALQVLTHLPDTKTHRRTRVDTSVKLVSVSAVAESPELNLARLAEVEPLARDLVASNAGARGDALQLARVHYWMGRAHFYRNEPRQAIGYYRQVLAVAQGAGDEGLLAIPSSVLGQVTLLVQGQFGKAEPLLAQSVLPLERAGEWEEWIRANAYLGASLAARGQYVSGLEHVQQTLARSEAMNNATGVGLCHLMLWLVHFMGGDTLRMLTESEAALKAAEKSGDQLQAYIGWGLKAWGRSRLREHAAAAENMSKSKAIGETLGGQLVLADWFAAADAELALNAGRLDAAVPLAAAAVAAGQAVNSAFSQGLAHRIWAGALSSITPPIWDEAEDHLASSLQLLESGDAVLEAARTRVAWGQLSRDRGNLVASAKQLEQAAAQFESAGLPAEAQRAREMTRT